MCGSSTVANVFLAAVAIVFGGGIVTGRMVDTRGEKASGVAELPLTYEKQGL
jgi:hypothetical protein